MEAKVIKTEFAQYDKAKWTGKNESGFIPVGDRVLVLPDSASETTSGGISLPQPLIERMTMSAETGVMVAIGDGAFIVNSDGISAYSGRKPKPGERVFVERYAGQIINGVDGKKYRVMDSRCIGAIQE